MKIDFYGLCNFCKPMHLLLICFDWSYVKLTFIRKAHPSLELVEVRGKGGNSSLLPLCFTLHINITSLSVVERIPNLIKMGASDKSW